MSESWNKQVLVHINRCANVWQDGRLVGENLLILNIDLSDKKVVFRENAGDGPEGFVWGGGIILKDIRNYKPGKSEL